MTLASLQHSKSTVGVLSEQLLTAKDVAQRLGVSERWVRDHATRRHPRIPVIKLGPILRFRLEDIEEFIHRQLQAAPSQNAENGI